jgi:hypothetical protein
LRAESTRCAARTKLLLLMLMLLVVIRLDIISSSRRDPLKQIWTSLADHSMQTFS